MLIFVNIGRCFVGLGANSFVIGYNGCGTCFYGFTVAGVMIKI